MHDTLEKQQQAFGEIEGSLVVGGAARGNARVELVDGQGSVVQSATTTNEGNYRFRNVDQRQLQGAGEPPKASAPSRRRVGSRARVTPRPRRRWICERSSGRRAARPAAYEDQARLRRAHGGIGRERDHLVERRLPLVGREVLAPAGGDRTAVSIGAFTPFSAATP